ncbi:MAG: ABC transporter permease [Deltaproteobacteria bacterium]|nr:ABC transporter permease [Deltaproteobacteria bacterium]
MSSSLLAAGPEAAPAPASTPPEGRRTLRVLGIPFLRARYLLASLGLAAIVLAAVVGPLLVPFDPAEQDIALRLKPPGTDGHLLGTDALGRDVLVRVLAGGRISLMVGLTGATLAAIVGIVLGMIAGYREGRIGTLIMGFVDAQLAFPFILLALVFVATLGSSLLIVMAVVALSSWVDFARPMHAMVLSLKRRDFVTAARSIGASDLLILRQHLFPHILATAVVIGTLQVANIILFESALSFLGMGVPPDIPTWGGMLSESRRYLQVAPWLSILPGLALLVTVFSLSIVGDWLRETLDPHREQHR